MWPIENYEVFDDYWCDMAKTFGKSPYLEPVPKKFHQKQLQMTVNGGVVVRLVAQSGLPTSLQIRQTIESGATKVTKLDVSEKYEPMERYRQFMGHLLIPQEGSQRPRGLHIVSIHDIPDDARMLIDENVQLLDKTFNHWLPQPSK